jgi:hypothetical protein
MTRTASASALVSSLRCERHPNDGTSLPVRWDLLSRRSLGPSPWRDAGTTAASDCPRPDAECVTISRPSAMSVANASRIVRSHPCPFPFITRFIRLFFPPA